MPLNLLEHEWPTLARIAEFEVLDDHSLDLRSLKATVARDKSLSLRLAVSGIGKGPSFDDVYAGRKSSTVPLKLRANFSRIVLVDAFVAESVKAAITEDDEEERTTVSGYAPQMIETIREGVATSMVEWLYFTPSGVTWPRRTLWERAEHLSRLRDGATLAQVVSRHRENSADHVRLELGLPSLSVVRFGRVGERASQAAHVPRAGLVEYEGGDAGVPDEPLRYATRAALSALFGTGIGLCGRSEFGADKELLRCTLMSGTSFGGDEIESPPYSVPQSNHAIDEGFCTRFLLAYLEKQAAFHFNRVVWLIRHSLVAPPDMAAAYSGTAFEILRKAFYAQPSRKEESRKLRKKFWRELRQELLGSIDQYFAAHTEVSEVSATDFHKSLDGLNAVSATKLNLRFMNDLGLNYGDAEEEALRARNDAAHGSPLNEKNFLWWTARSDALRTLASRALAAVLSVAPPGYIDYGASGPRQFPVRVWGERQQLRESKPEPDKR